MSKYDCEIDLSENSSTGLILKKIRQGSIVLEFGCATGRMTKYMQEALHCQVYIVEIDKEAYDTALKYAADGVCGDIMDLEWKGKFSDIPFDYIIFADVLEHLSDPDTVIAEASKLLAPAGNIIFSIPNITHNDIILKAINDHFDYTDIGLLDNTHKHFWGFENIKPFAEKNGLFIHNIEATYCDTGSTEQYKGELRNIPPILLNILNERNFGNVYQFVVTTELRVPEKEAALSAKQTGIISSLYLDMGQDFDEDDKISFRIKPSEDGKYIFNYLLDKTEAVQKIRFDPVEGQGCILKELTICQGDDVLTPSFGPNISLSSSVLLMGDDPMVFATLRSDSLPVRIKAEILLLSSDEYIDALIQTIKSDRMCADSLKADNESLKSGYDALKADNDALKADHDALKSDHDALKADNEALKADNKTLKSDCDNLRTENTRLKETIQAEIIHKNAYSQLADAKDELLIHYEQQTSELLNKICQMTAQIDLYQRRKCVRFSDMVGRIIRK